MAAPLILHVFPTFAVGGAQARFCAIANHAGAAYRHAVLALDGVTRCRDRLSPGLDVSFPALTLRKGTMLGNLGVIRAFLHAMAPSALVTSNFGAIEFAIANQGASRIRHVHMEDGFGPEERATQLRRRVWARRLALRRSAVLLPSHVLLDIARGVWRLPARNLHFVPNGVDLSRPRADARTGPVVIGTVAALRAEKNLGRLIGALPHVPDARLTIVGDGPEAAKLRAQADALGLTHRVSFAGHLNDPAPAYAGFDIFALSSDTEQMPLSVLEAMAAGLPVVATDVGDVRRMVSAENVPFVMPPAREDAFAEGLARLAGDLSLRRALGQANRRRAEAEFDQAAMIRRHLALWDGVPPA